MNQNEFNVNDNNYEYTPETPSRDGFDTPLTAGERFAEKIRAIFSSKAFFVATIAYTVMAGASVISGSFDLFSILFTIAMWMAYSVAKRETPIKEMKFLSGVLKAYYIVTVIGIVVMLIAAVLLIAFAPSVMDLDAAIDSELSSFISGSGGYENMFMEIEGDDIEYLRFFQSMLADNLQISLADLLGILMIVMGVVFIIAAVVMIIFNELLVHKLSRQFANTLEALALNRETELRLGGIRAFLIALGVLTAISAFFILVGFDLILAAGEAASAVACFALSSAIADK